MRFSSKATSLPGRARRITIVGQGARFHGPLFTQSPPTLGHNGRQVLTPNSNP